MSATETPTHLHENPYGLARAQLTRGFEAFVVAENVLDREYQEALGYPALGRSVRAGLRFRTGS